MDPQNDIHSSDSTDQLALKSEDYGMEFINGQPCANDTMPPINPEVLCFVNVINALICFVGLTGNILVFYVVCRFSAMHTVTNMFIMMLAVADIAFLVNIPFLMTTAFMENWPFGNLYCKIYYSMSTVNQFASSFFLVTMSVDRYVAICLPIRGRRIRTTKTAALVCSVVWALAIMLMYPVFLYAETDSATDGSVTHCNIFWPDYYIFSGNHAFVLYCFVLGYAFPVLFMLTFYGLVINKLRSRGRLPRPLTATSCKVSKPPSSINRRNRLRRVTVMIFVVILVYLLCWTPYWGSQLYITFNPSNQLNHLMGCPMTPAEIEASQWIVYTSLILQCLCFANSAINPVIYAVLSENFKQSYAKACGRSRLAKFEEVPSATRVRVPSWQTEPYSHGTTPAPADDEDPSDGDDEEHRRLANRRLRIPSYTSHTTHTTSCTEKSHIFTPRSQGLDQRSATGEDLRSLAEQEPVVRGEVLASFQITAWTPTSGKGPIITRKTLHATFEMTTSADEKRSST